MCTIFCLFCNLYLSEIKNVNSGVIAVNKAIFGHSYSCIVILYIGAPESVVESFSLLVSICVIFFPSQPSDNAEVDLAVLAALPRSMQLDILAQVRF